MNRSGTNGGSAIRVDDDGHDVSVGLGGVSAGRLEFATGAAHLTLHDDPDLDDLLRARFDGSPPRVRSEGGSVTVRHPRLSTPLEWRRRRADVTLSPSVPWEVVIRGGVAKARADLRRTPLTALVVGGASDVEMLLPEPARHMTIRINGGASGVRLTRPNGVPVRLQIRGGASKLAFDAQAFGAIGGGVRLQSPGFEDAAGRYDVIVGGGASRLTVASA